MASSRKAWNEAMRSTAGASALPPSLQPNAQKRRSDRRKNNRSNKVRKVTADLLQDPEYRAAVWMDALEDVDTAAAAGSGTGGADDEDYDVFDELEDKSNKKSKAKRSSSRKSSSSSGGGVLPKRLRPRSLASILMEEASRDGVAKDFIESEAWCSAQQLPVRKFCPVTGLKGKYREPRTGISYSSLKALEQIRERPPPWMTLGGTPTYLEAVKFFRGNADEEI